MKVKVTFDYKEERRNIIFDTKDVNVAEILLNLEKQIEYDKKP